MENDEDDEEEDSLAAFDGGQCLVCNDCDKKFTSVAFAQLHASKTGHEDFAESTEAIPVLTEEEKKERLAELKGKLVEKRKLEAEKLKEEDKANELIRRKATKDVGEVKRQLEEKEAKKELEKRMREKQDEKIQLARVKAQIEEDRRRMKEKAEEERMRAQGQQAVHISASPTKLTMETSSIKSETIRLQIRLPDGAVIRETVQPSLTLNRLLALIDEKSSFSTSSHALMIALPPRNFDTATEGSKTMAELGLSPSASFVLRKK